MNAFWKDFGMVFNSFFVKDSVPLPSSASFEREGRVRNSSMVSRAAERTASCRTAAVRPLFSGAFV